MANILRAGALCGETRDKYDNSAGFVLAALE
jgi:hypothetical protein